MPLSAEEQKLILTVYPPVIESICHWVELFNHRPFQWGLRGDKYIWVRMQMRLSTMECPKSPDAFMALVHQDFIRQVGKLPDTEDRILVEDLPRGGMSGGFVSGKFWVEKGFPLLQALFKHYFSNG